MLNKHFLIITSFLMASFLTLLGAYVFVSNKKLEIFFLDVGQGDSILIKTPCRQNILIDGGPDRTVEQRLGEHLNFLDKKIDLIILTHPHDDHLIGLINILKNYSVKNFFYTGAVYNSAAFSEWEKLIKQQKLILQIPIRPLTADLGCGVKLKFIFPVVSLWQTKFTNINNSSIVNQLIYEDKKVLFTGDAEFEEENILLQHPEQLKSDILKVGHHGSDGASGDDFLKAVNPQVGIIEVGQNNKFKHPSLRTLKKFERFKIPIWRTDLNKTIKVAIENGAIKVEPEQL